jgi:hypothetical protein
MRVVLRWKEVQAQFLFTSRWLGASGLLERRLKAFTWSWRIVSVTPRKFNSQAHLTTNDTSKSLTSPSDHLSPSSCLHRAFPLGPSLFPCVRWISAADDAVCRFFALHFTTL